MAISEFDDLQKRAAQLLAQGEAKEALEHMRAAFRLDPTEPRMLFNLAAVEHNTGDKDRAAGLFRRCVLADPGFAPAYARVILAQSQSETPRQTRQHLQRVLCLMPLSAQSHALNTQYLYELDQHELVGAAGRAALVLDPLPAGVYRLMGLSIARLQNMEEAAALLSRACILQPGWADARLALAGALFTLHDHEGVLREADVAVALGGNAAEGAFWQARAALALNRLGDADQYFARAVALEPDRQVNAGIARLTLTKADFKPFHDATHQHG